jgi:hypothetical protein
MSVYTKGNSACVLNYRPTRVSLYNNLVIVPDLLAYYFKCKLISCQHCWLQSQSTIANLVSHLAYLCLSVCSQRQVYAIYHDGSNASNLVTHTFLFSPPLAQQPLLILGRLIIEAGSRRPTHGSPYFHNSSMPTGCVTNRSSSSSDHDLWLWRWYRAKPKS